MDQSASAKRKLFEDSNAGSKRKNQSILKFYGDALEHEENVSDPGRFICPCVKSERFFNVGKNEKKKKKKKVDTSNLWFGFFV